MPDQTHGRDRINEGGIRLEDRPMPIEPSRVREVFGAAVGCESEEGRAALLDRECSADPALRRRVVALLQAHDKADDLLDRPIAVGLPPFDEFERDDPGAPGSPGSGGDPADSDRTIGLHPSDDLTIAGSHLGVSKDAVVPVVEGYEILEELGRGGMGVVYKARQVLLNRPCALKMILGGALAGPDVFARFLGEAQAIARLHHPHIVQIHAIGEAGGLPFIELEHVEGGGLDESLDGTPWEARRAARFVESLASAVAEAHRRGIIHRDLKPANILLTPEGMPKIADFGLAKSSGDDSGLTATDSIMGSPAYMAPEQAAGLTRLIGPPADIYSLGATLYELLTGRPPSRGPSILETLDLVKNVEPVTPSRLVPGLPVDVETIAMKCLQKEPGKRYEGDSSEASPSSRGPFRPGNGPGDGVGGTRARPPWARRSSW